MMKIIDPDGREREVLYVKKTIGREWDVINEVEVVKPFVEVMIKGRLNNWKQFYPLHEFLENNHDEKILKMINQ